MDKLKPRAVSSGEINDHVTERHRLDALSRTICLGFILVRDHQSSSASEYAGIRIPRSDEHMKSSRLQFLEDGWDSPSANVANLVQKRHLSSLQFLRDHRRDFLQHFARRRVRLGKRGCVPGYAIPKRPRKVLLEEVSVVFRAHEDHRVDSVLCDQLFQNGGGTSVEAFNPRLDMPHVVVAFGTAP